jgi:hypothetical protein
VHAARDEAASYAGVDAFVKFLNDVTPLNGIGWARVANMVLTKSLQVKKNAEETLETYLDRANDSYNTSVPLEQALVELGDWYRPGDVQLRKLLHMKLTQDFEELCHYAPPIRKRRWSTGNEESARLVEGLFTNVPHKRNKQMG